MEPAPYTPIDPNATMPRKVKIIAIMHLIVAPVAYLIVAHFMKMSPREGGQYEMLFYILLLVAVVFPAVMPIIRRAQTNLFKQTADSAMTPDQLFTSTSIVHFAVTNTVYIMGVFLFFLSAKLPWLYYFYPIGIVWSVIYWPTDAKYRAFLEKLRGNEPTVG